MVLRLHMRGLNSSNSQIISIWIKNIAIFKASLLLYLSVFFQGFFKNIFVMSLFSFHNDTIGRIATRPLAVTISISYGNPIESGI